MGFSRQEYWSGLPFPSPGDLSDPGIKPVASTKFPALQTDSLPLSWQGSPKLRICIQRGPAESSPSIHTSVSLPLPTHWEPRRPGWYSEGRRCTWASQHLLVPHHTVLWACGPRRELLHTPRPRGPPSSFATKPETTGYMRQTPPEVLRCRSPGHLGWSIYRKIGKEGQRGGSKEGMKGEKERGKEGGRSKQ